MFAQPSTAGDATRSDIPEFQESKVSNTQIRNKFHQKQAKKLSDEDDVDTGS